MAYEQNSDSAFEEGSSETCEVLDILEIDQMVWRRAHRRYPMVRWVDRLSRRLFHLGRRDRLETYGNESALRSTCG